MRRPWLVVFTAWTMHFVAWFVPVEKDGVRLSEGLPGWQAFRVGMAALWPYEGLHFDSTHAAVLSTLSAMTTPLFVLGSPCVVLWGSRSIRKVSAWVALTAFVVDAHWFVLFGPDRWDLRIGYYLWWFSFLVLAFGCFQLVRHDRAVVQPMSQG
jgi:hypothetical protein